MTIANVFAFLKKSPSKGQGWKNSLHSAERFREILNSERMRTDRSGVPFCLVVYALDESHETACAAFVKSLQQRLRGTDHIGLFGESEVAIILWDTREPGARKYAETMKSDMHLCCVRNTKLYVYPMQEGAHNINGTNERYPAAEVPLNGSASKESAVAVEPLHILYLQPLPRWKRLIDICGAGVGLLLLSPLLIVTALLIKLTSKGPVLFRQQRDGLGGKRFWIYKFRTMRQDAERLKDELRQFSEQDGPAFKLTNDPRITPIGRYLRKTCIDELPQLWNVLKGEMTLVGPRPLDSKEAAQIQGWGRRRQDVTPGLTCIWQVYGKSRVSFNEWMRMDIRYISRRGLLKDLKLIGNTILAVICHRAST